MATIVEENKPKIAMLTMCIGAEYQKKWKSAARSKEIFVVRFERNKKKN